MKETSSKISEQQIVALFRTKDIKCIKMLYDLYGNLVYGLICRILKNEQQAEEVLQTTFLKVWDEKDHFSFQKSSLLSWVLNIARTSAQEVLWSDTNRKQTKSDQRIPCPENDIAAIKVGDIEIKNLVSQLPEKYKIILEYVYLNGFTYEEVASKLDIPLEQVSKDVREAFQELRALFK